MRQAIPACVAFPMIHFPNVEMLLPHSLRKNQICGMDEYGRGTFTLDAINALCAAMPKCHLTSIK